MRTWYAVAQNDEAIPPDVERQFAKRMDPTVIEVASGHVAMVSHPDEVADLVRTAARLISSGASRPPRVHRTGLLDAQLARMLVRICRRPHPNRRRPRPNARAQLRKPHQPRASPHESASRSEVPALDPTLVLSAPTYRDTTSPSPC
jgi:hypothetical protein